MNRSKRISNSGPLWEKEIDCKWNGDRKTEDDPWPMARADGPDANVYGCWGMWGSVVMLRV